MYPLYPPFLEKPNCLPESVWIYGTRGAHVELRSIRHPLPRRRPVQRRWMSWLANTLLPSWRWGIPSPWLMQLFDSLLFIVVACCECCVCCVAYCGILWHEGGRIILGNWVMCVLACFSRGCFRWQLQMRRWKNRIFSGLLVQITCGSGTNTAWPMQWWRTGGVDLPTWHLRTCSRNFQHMTNVMFLIFHWIQEQERLQGWKYDLVPRLNYRKPWFDLPEPQQGLPGGYLPSACRQVLKLRTDVEIARPLSLADFPEAPTDIGWPGHRCLSARRQVATARVIYSAGDIVFFCNRGGHGTACVRVRVGQSGITRILIESNRWGRSLIFCLMISCRSWHLELETNASAELTLLFDSGTL